MTTKRSAASTESILVHTSIKDERFPEKSHCACEKCKDELYGVCLSKVCKCCTVNVSRRSVYTGWGNSKYRQRNDVDIAEEYATIREWFLNVSKGSEKNYRIIMLKFMHYLHLNPDQFLDLARKDPHAAHTRIKEFWHILRKEEGVSSKTRAAAYTAIRSFLRWNDISIGKMPSMFIGKVQYESNHILQSAEVSKLIDHAKHFRDQALISFIAQSGQRTGVVSAMKYQHVQNDLEQGVNPIVVNVNAELIGGQGANMNKIGFSYRFALGRECATFLRMSLNHRRGLGEDLTRDSWLFPARSRLVGFKENGQPICIWLRPGETGPPLTTTGIHRIVVSTAKRAGLDRIRFGPRLHGARTTSHEIHPHTFRRWWKFQMRRGGVIDNLLLEHMMGQRDVRLRHGANYDVFDPEYIRREYSKAESFLTVCANPVVYGIESHWEPGEPPPQQSYPGQQYPPGLDGKIIGHFRTMSEPASLHRVVKESQLASYFSRGWQYVATLPSGGIVIGNSCS